ncbi:serine/threonine-protein kinase [Actinomadura sp. WMMB 499]|uniref:serine/threonine-protein kinase n=1 Tax=Actinomadura sp. WMMB 499 TaxID=1219491 RepID=UPI00159EA000|nr:serine/threonine-protein kinase [Actinomadura sp. WMMB 499]
MTEDVPGYRVLEQVGEGGFSVVYRANQERLDRTVALKVLSVSAVDEAAMRRFQRECKITGRLSGHPNIVTVLDTGTTRSGRPYIAMEYFEHGALSDRLAREGALGVAEVLRVGVKMAGALAATHETDVLHRDVKPQNVLLSRYGEPALADFGIAGLVDSFDATHTQAFTPHHAAPEILQGGQPGVGADIYSLGSTLYQLLADRPAFKGPPGEGIGYLMMRIMNEPPPAIPRPDVPREVQEVIGRAMAKTPEQRYASAVEFAQALQSAQARLGLPVTDLAFGGASTLPHTGGGPAPFSGTGGTGSSSGPSMGAPGGRLSFPDASGPPPVPEWAPTTHGPANPRPLPMAPAAAQAPGATADTSPGTRTPRTPRARHHQAPPDLRDGSAAAPGRPHGPAPAAPPAAPHTGPHDGPSRGLIVAVCVALVGGLALGIGALVASGGEHPYENRPSAGGGDGEPPAAAPSAPLEPVTAEQIAAARPQDLATKATGNGALLAWKLPPAAQKLPLLVQRDPAGSEPIKSVEPGSTRTTVSPLLPDTNCFRVGAVIRVNQGASPDVSWSKVACVREQGQGTGT